MHQSLRLALRLTSSSVLVLGMVASQSGCGYLVIHGTRALYREYKQQNRDVNAALARYRIHMLQGEPAEAAELFGADAEWTHDQQAPIVGRAAILGHLTAASELRLIEYDITASDTRLIRDGAVQSGSYRQKQITPQGELLTAQGQFEARWSHEPGNPWRIATMRTTAAANANATTTAAAVTTAAGG